VNVNQARAKSDYIFYCAGYHGVDGAPVKLGRIAPLKDSTADFLRAEGGLAGDRSIDGLARDESTRRHDGRGRDRQLKALCERTTQIVQDIAWKAQTRLCSGYRQLEASGKLKVQVSTAVAGELAGFMRGTTGLDRFESVKNAGMRCEIDRYVNGHLSKARAIQILSSVRTSLADIDSSVRVRWEYNSVRDEYFTFVELATKNVYFNQRRRT
jgi:hypothetical protein